jgi:hypothetical protein
MVLVSQRLILTQQIDPIQFFWSGRTAMALPIDDNGISRGGNSATSKYFRQGEFELLAMRVSANNRIDCWSETTRQRDGCP